MTGKLGIDNPYLCISKIYDTSGISVSMDTVVNTYHDDVSYRLGDIAYIRNGYLYVVVTDSTPRNIHLFRNFVGVVYRNRVTGEVNEVFINNDREWTKFICGCCNANVNKIKNGYSYNFYKYN